MITPLSELFAYQFMVNAFAAGTIAAVMAAVIGWYVVLRREAFAAHTLALIGFPGASAAALIGWPVALGYVAFTGLGALAMAPGLAFTRRREANETATIGTIQAFALALGYLFVTLSHTNLSAAQTLLFGSFLGITSAQVDALAVVAVLVIVTMTYIARPLFFASIDADVATARGVPTRVLSLAFIGMLAATVAAVSQITGALLVFALLVIPAATAQRITVRPDRGIAWSIVVAVAVTWAGLATSYFGDYPIGFTVTSFAFAAFLVVRATEAITHRGTSRGIA